MKKALATWHLFVETKDPKYLDELLAEDVVFHSPVLHTPQEGKRITKAYLMSAMEILGAKGSGFAYNLELVNESNALLEFNTEIDGISINGVDMIAINKTGKIVNFKVMIRPLKAIQIVHQKMSEMLSKK
jgi:hypothetical protein